MQSTNVLIALRGDLTNTVPKSGVTAAEIGVLIMSHGQGSVSEIPGSPRTEGVRVKHSKEYARLVGAYGAEPVAAAYGPSGFGVKLPTRINEVLHDEDDELEEEEEDEDEVPTPPAPAKVNLAAALASPPPAGGDKADK